MNRRRRAMHAAPLVALLGSSLIACTGGRRRTPPAGPLAPSRVESFQVVMPELGDRRRTVRVYLPKGYADGTVSFPVLYLQDAQQLFAPGPFGDWRAVSYPRAYVEGSRAVVDALLWLYH